MRSVFDGLKKRVSLTSTNQLIGADYPPGKGGGCSCGQQLDQKMKKEQAAQVDIESTTDTEPVYNELDQPSGTDRSAPISDRTAPLGAEAITSLETDFLDEDDIDEKFYLDIEDSQLASGTQPDSFRMGSNSGDGPADSGDSSFAYTSSNNSSLTPDEILQLYARVDKSKKKRNRMAENNQKSIEGNSVANAEDIRSTERHTRRKITHSKKILDDFHPNKVNDLHPRRVVAVSFHEINELNSASRLSRVRDLRWPQHVCGRDRNVTLKAESRPLPPLPPRSQSDDNPSDPVDDVHIYATLPTPS